MVTVTGTYADPAGKPASGWVGFTPDVAAVNAGRIITQAMVVGELDATGSFSVDLLASDDPGWALPDGQRMPYIITESVAGLQGGWMAYIDGPGPADISELVPLVEAPTFPTWDPLATFDYHKTNSPIAVGDSWTEINALAIDRPAGLYVWAVSVTWVFDSSNRSAEFRFSTDGGQTWGEAWRLEPSDNTNRHPLFYSFPVQHAGGPRSVIMQARKLSAQGVLTVTYSDLWYQRVG